jgi:hypothetical protein
MPAADPVGLSAAGQIGEERGVNKRKRPRNSGVVAQQVAIADDGCFRVTQS